MRANLVEYEVYVKDGWAYDDEGNRERVKGIADGVYGGSEFSRMVRGTRRGPSYGRARYSRQPSPANAEQVQAIDRALEYQPGSRFLRSIRDQLAAGRPLSDKQRRVVREILIGLGGTASAKLFEEEAMDDSLEEKRSGFVFPERPSPVGKGKGSWPIGDKKHALIAISYMRTGKGDEADYPKIKKAIESKYGKDKAVMGALNGLGEAREDDAVIITNLYPDYPI